MTKSKAFTNFMIKYLVAQASPSDSYYFMRRIFSIGLGFIYMNAFLIYFNQALGLYGSKGLLPYAEFVPQVRQSLASSGQGFWSLLSIFWFSYSDMTIQIVAILGIFLSTCLIFGVVNFPILFGLWILHMSVIHVGQIFYGYGWETQLLELTFLSFFLFPFLNPCLHRSQSPPKKIAIYFQRWMMFRLMLGAGLIKIRGDQCWRDLTCTQYHYETQPNPHPLSWFFHQLPNWFHTGEVLANHAVEIILPFALFGPKWVRRGVGLIMIFFQVSLIVSGNLAWLNWITIVMVIPCFDDEFLEKVFRFEWMKKWRDKFINIKPYRPPPRTLILLFLFTFAGIILSIDPALNLVSKRQMMNVSFNRFHLINSYGAFGSVGKFRNEIIISGTHSERPTENTHWKEYEFNCKPGALLEAPCLITPYHYRLDWQIWFSAMRPRLSEIWLHRLAVGFLDGNESILDLIASNPFSDKPPKYIKMDLYRYEFTRQGERGWWKRRALGSYMQPIALDSPIVNRHRVSNLSQQ